MRRQILLLCAHHLPDPQSDDVSSLPVLFLQKSLNNCLYPCPFHWEGTLVSEHVASDPTGSMV